MKNRSIELVIMFQEKKPTSLALFDYLRDMILRLYNVEFDEFEYSFIVNDREKKKVLKYKKANIEKCIEDLKNNDGMGFELQKYLPNSSFKYRDIQLSISYNPYLHLNKVSSVILTINEEFYFVKNTLSDLKLLYLQIVDFLIKLDKKVFYGFISSLENIKNPSLYVVGIGNFDLSKKEQRDLFLWANENNNAIEKIWRIFWGNLITDSHLKNGYSTDKLKEIVGEKNFCVVDNHTYFFNLPNNDLLYGNEHEISEKELQRILKILT